MVGIYKITNNINDKVYVGQSINIEQRWKAHRTKPNQVNGSQYDSPLYRAIRKYGLSNFSFEVIEECKQEDLNEREIYWINFYQSFNLDKGYNLTLGGSNPGDTVLSKEQVTQIQNLLINSKLTEAEISKQFSISQRMVSGINLGQNWIDTNLSYPLRKKVPKKYFCKDCGAEISNIKATYCKNCSNEKRRVVTRPDREKLKKQIRNFSFLELGRQYKVSDNAIRKWCQSYNLPYQKKVIKSLTDEEWSKI